MSHIMKELCMNKELFTDLISLVPRLSHTRTCKKCEEERQVEPGKYYHMTG